MPIRNVEVRGLVEARAKVSQVIDDLRGAPFQDAMRQVTLVVTADAKRFAPVDTGRLRASITPEVRQEGTTTMGIVGTNVVYAAAMELGSRPHMPPVKALEVWARRHGVSALTVALKIKAKGTKPRFYLRNALDKNERLIVERLGAGVAGIVSK